MRNKKGAGTIISWVLLLGFTIGLATTVFLWTTRQTEEMSEHTTRFVECGMDCDNVMINVANFSAESCSPKRNCCLKITNTRYLDIEKVLLRALEDVDDTECGPLKVAQPPVPIYCGQDWAPQNVSVMPLIKVKNELCSCKNKAITVEC